MDGPLRPGSRELSMITMERPEIETRPDTGLRTATGRGRQDWFEQLDAWGARDRASHEIADWLVDDQGLSDWWAQKLIVEYQQARGTRPPGIRPGGTFSVGASKTVGVPLDRLFAAFTDLTLRERWLPGVALQERAVRPGRSIRFDVGDDGTRLNVTFAALGGARAQVAVEQEKLPDPGTAARMKAFWQERVTALKSELEG